MRLRIASVALLPLTFAGPVSIRQAGCYAGVFIIAAPPHDNTTPGLQQSLINNVLAAIPNSESYVVPYDSSNTDYATGIANGDQLMTQQIESYAASCPSSAIVLMGYSEGGIVMMNTICGASADGTNPLPTQYTANVIAAIAYGEETFVPGETYDAGTCTVGPSEHPRGNPSSCDPFSASIQSYCDSGDERCCSGTDPNAHGEYNIYDDAATQFIVGRFNSSSSQRI